MPVAYQNDPPGIADESKNTFSKIFKTGEVLAKNSEIAETRI